jgi:DNA-binding beta-propeller fold protein YncE
LLLAREENRLYVLNRGTDAVSVLSTPSLQDMGRIPVGPGPRSLVRDDRTGYLYIASEVGGEILVYDPLTASVVTALAVDSTPSELAFDASLRQLHVASGMRRRVLTVDVETGEITAQTSLCALVEGLVLEPLSRRLFAAAGHCRQVSLLQPVAGMEIRAIALDGEPGLMALSADRRRILVTLPAANRLAICNVNSARVEVGIETGRRPYGVVAP